jgi:hypothetical protein
MSAMATTAAWFPAIAEILRHEADTDPELREDPNFLLRAKQENRGDETVLRALAGKLGATRHRWANQVLEAVLDRDSWAVPDDTFKAVLTDDGVGAVVAGSTVSVAEGEERTRVVPTLRRCQTSPHCSPFATAARTTAKTAPVFK